MTSHFDGAAQMAWEDHVEAFSIGRPSLCLLNTRVNVQLGGIIFYNPYFYFKLSLSPHGG